MGILSSLFGKTETLNNADVFKKYAKELLVIAKVQQTNANILKATVYLCFCQLACIHAIAKGKAAVFMDAMVDDAKKSVLDFQVKVGDLARSEAELEKILQDFPAAASVDQNTRINGLAAFEAIYFAFVEEIVSLISEKSGGPMGPHGYSAIVFLEALRGPGNGKDGFIEVSMKLTEMTGLVIKAFR